MHWFFAVFISWVLILAGFEYPVFGIILIVIVIAIIIFFIYLEIGSREDAKEEEKRKITEAKREAQNLKYEEELLEELSDEIQAILKKEIKVISAAYRKSVTSNSFGKKNYDKFIPELLEFIEDNYNIFKDLEEHHDVDAGSMTLTEDSIKSVISLIEENIEKQNSDSEYSDDMDPFDYEHYCASEFQKSGWEAKATQGSSDQGVDVKATKDSIILVAQCKKFAKPVGNKAVQEVVAGMKYYEANQGVVIAPNGFTNSAEKLAEANNIKLIHHSEIKEL
tara:strand:- start:1402 stop:2238 length:837 start_codon:yes stop_codon:yes gene_type:complete